MGVTEKDEVLVLTDVAKMTLGNAFTMACRDLGAQTVMALMPLTGEHGNEPPGTIAALWERPGGRDNGRTTGETSDGEDDRNYALS